MVECADGKPARIWAGSIRGDVISLAGPWRTAGDWWTQEPWSHNEWDIALRSFSSSRTVRTAIRGLSLIPSGTMDRNLYRIYHDFQSDSWHIEGSYD